VNIVKKLIPALGVLALSTIMVGHATPAAAAGLDVDVAYQYLHISSGGSGESVPAGFAAGIGIPTRMNDWKVIGDFGWNRKKEDDVSHSATTFAGGLRLTPMSDKMSKAHPYFQAVLGGERDKDSGGGFSASDTNFMVQPGVGATFPMGSWSTFVEGDYRHVFSSGSAANDLVLRVGVCLKLGK
jgi:outer membrane protein with beta-barrel domain